MYPKAIRSFCAALALAINSCAPADTQDFPADEDLEVMLRFLVEDGETPGIVVGLLEADGSTRILSYGSAGPDAQPLGPRSVFEIGSITKTFTGTLLADMVARGEVAFEDPVSKYLPDQVPVPTIEGQEITLLDLATHTSGIDDEAVMQILAQRGFAPENPQTPWAKYTVEALYTWLSEYELPREPGAEFDYSNFGMGLLGHALARASNTTLQALMEERVLGPLGMDMTGFALEGELAEWVASGHRDQKVAPIWLGTEASEGAGGLRSSAEDLLSYLSANVGQADTDLERAMRVAQEPRRPVGDGPQRIGLAWRTTAVNGRRIVMHGGGTGGFDTEVAFDPERRVGVVILTNSTDFGDNLGQDLIGGRLPPTLPEIALDPEALAPFAGEYQSGGGLPLYVRLDENGYLTGQAQSQVRFRLFATSDSSFYAKRVPFIITFHTDEEGKVEDLVLAVNERTNRFARIGDDVPPSAVAAGNASPPLSAEEIARYEGTYAIEIEGETVEFRVYGEGDRLMGDVGGRGVIRLLPRSEHEFAVSADPRIRIIFTLEDGRAQSVTLHQPDGTVSGPRIG
jgi:CubicO group peptidase (beta-lactamase class C family)